MNPASLAILQLHLCPTLGPAAIEKLLELHADPQEILDRLPELPHRFPWLRLAGCDSSKLHDQAIKEIEQAAVQGIEILTLADADYPLCLRRAAPPPAVIYLQGDRSLLDPEIPSLALVGSRSPTPYGVFQAERFAAALSGWGFAIWSGLARGIDSICHRAALRQNGRSGGVVGSGLLDIYPRDDPRMIQSLKTKGVLISEFPLRMPPRKQNFPRRNRILAAQSWGVVVFEAALRSGSLITAHWAVEQGKELFVLPGRVDSPMSRGCHYLIREGAHLVEDPEEIFHQWHPHAPPTQNQNDAGSPLVALLRGKTIHLDQICRSVKKPPEEVIAELIRLQVEGRVVRSPGGYFRGAG